MTHFYCKFHNLQCTSLLSIGMVFMSSSALDWSPLLKGWLLKRPEIDKDAIYALFEGSFPKTLQYAREELNFKMPYLDAFFLSQCCTVLGGLYSEQAATNDMHLTRYYVMSLMWSIGALLELDDRTKIEQFLRENTNLNFPDCVDDATIFDHYVEKSGEWSHWNRRVEEWVYPKDSVPNYTSILVPNVDNVRTEFLLDCIAKQNKGVLLIGEAGSAKTVIVTKYMNKYNPELHLQKSLNFSSATTPEMFQVRKYGIQIVFW